MRAIALESFETGPTLHDLPVPTPDTGEVLVRVRHASINGFDVAVAAGMVKGMMSIAFLWCSARISPERWSRRDLTCLGFRLEMKSSES